MSAPTVVILAAGEGTRMRSDTPKVLHPICGRPMVLWPIAAAQAAGAARIVVVDGPDRRLAAHLPEGVDVAVQEEPRGTGDAVRAASDWLDGDGPVIVVAGDVPLITAELLSELAATHEASGAAATMATTELDDPTAYGRVVRDDDGSVLRVAETKDPTHATAEELAIREVSTAIFAFEPGSLRAALDALQDDNAQGEYFLPDVLPALRARGETVATFELADPALALGVNDRSELALVRALAQARIHAHHARAGVTIVDPAATLIDVDVVLGRDTVVEPSTFLRGATRVGERSRVGPLCTLIDCELGDEVGVVHSYLDSCVVRDGATIGPFAYLRPGTELGERAKAGTFVEIKNSDIGAGAKVPHLSYVGDADIGEDANIGAGTITANYDGRDKHRTKVGARARVSVDTALVAPVELGDDAWTAAGSVITEDVPPGALGVARSKQRNIPGYSERKSR